MMRTPDFDDPLLRAQTEVLAAAHEAWMAINKLTPHMTGAVPIATRVEMAQSLTHRARVFRNAVLVQMREVAELYAASPEWQAERMRYEAEIEEWRKLNPVPDNRPTVSSPAERQEG